eukprot:TRINITY_DN8251_c0_g1_i4.p1 TRINITY_DN8251_c0_g1~~TRINITY_DN8251_c0_g1_i4.p1  ORF type:complete len:374 (+),score=58.27 TRINITY_DN8251_c0_g1_i4:98-1123(+)
MGCGSSKDVSPAADSQIPGPQTKSLSKFVEQRGYRGGGKTEMAKKAENLVQAYCDGMSKHHTDGSASYLSLFAVPFTMADPCDGSPLKTTKKEVKEFMDKVPEVEMTAKQVFVQDDGQCAALLEMAIKNGPSFNLIDTFNINDKGQIVEQRGYRGGGKTEMAKKAENMVQDYCAGMSNHHTDGSASYLSLFAADGSFTMADPCDGSPLKTTKKEVKEFMDNVPEVTMTAKQVFVQDDGQCAALLEMAIKNGPSFNLIDTFKINDQGQIVEQRGYRGGGKMEMAKKAENMVQAYCDGMSKHHTDGSASYLSLFAADGSFTMADRELRKQNVVQSHSDFKADL